MDDELRSVVFYVENNRIVGVLLYNVFGEGVIMARKIIEDRVPAKNIPDLARLFRLYGRPSDETEDSGTEKE